MSIFDFLFKKQSAKEIFSVAIDLKK